MPRAPAALVALTALAAAIRFATLTAQSLWIDESVTALLVQASFADMLSAIPDSESTPPLYYVLAWLWTQVFGAGEAGLRSLSALLGAATIPLAYVAAARLVSSRAGLVVAALAAVNPLLVWFSQEARAYALLVFLTAAALAVFARLLERPTGRALAGWAVLSALALATHYFALFVVAPQVAWLLWRTRGRGRDGRRVVLAACGAVVAAGAALLPLAIGQARNDRADFIRADDLPSRALQVPKQYLAGFDAPLEAAAAIASLALAAYGLWRLARRADVAERRGAAVAAAIAVPALVLPVLLAAVGPDYVITRNLIAAWVPAMIVVAAGLGARRAGKAGIAAAAALCALWLALVVAVNTSVPYQREDWRGVARALGPVPAGGRAIVVTPFLGRVAIAHYAGSVRPFPSVGANVAEVDVVAVAGRQDGGSAAPPAPSQPPPLVWFGPPEVIRGKTFTIVRYRATGGRSDTNMPLLGELALAPGPSFGVQPPP